MKRQIPKSNDGLHLDNPVLIESKTSFVMQFLFYFLFLLLGVTGAYGCFYTTFSVPLNLQVVMTFAIVYCVIFTILFITKTHRFLLLFLSLAAALFAVLFRRSLTNVFINYLKHGFMLTYNSVISVYAQKLQYNLFTFQIAPAGINEMKASSTIFAVFTLFFVTLLLAWMLIKRRNTILCFLLTVPFLGMPVVFNIIPNYTAVAALYVFWAFLILNSSFLLNKSKFNKKIRVFSSGGKTAANPHSIIILPILVASLMLVSVMYPMDGFQRSDVVKNLRTVLLNVPKIPSPIQIPIQSILGYNNRVNLQLVGDITFTGETVLRVKSSSHEGEYLKGFVGSIYTGQSWEPLPENEYKKLDLMLNKWKVQNFSSHFNELFGRPTNTYDMTVQNVKRNSLRVYTPYGLISKPEELPGINFINDGYLRSNNSLFGIREYSMKASSLQIDTWKKSESLMRTFTSEQPSFINAAKEYNNFINSHYTQLPEELDEKLDRYRREHNLNVEHFLSPNAFAYATIYQIHSENTYSLSPGMTPTGHDFVEYFLYENHKGYCVHFASATVALLRSAGVPARYVEGYAISPSDFESYDGWAKIPDSRSHAWVEIYLNGIGWVPIEATPSARRGIIDHEAAELEASFASNPLENEVTDDQWNIKERTLNEKPDDEENSEFDYTEFQSSTSRPVIKTAMQILLALVMIVLLTTGILTRRKMQISSRNILFTQQDKSKAAIAVYEYIAKLYAYAKPNGTANLRIPKDLYNLVLKARFSQHMLTEQELGGLLLYAENQAIEIQTTLKLFKRFIGKYVYALF